MSHAAFVFFARATGSGLRCPETARQSPGIVLEPAPLISQSKKGFPVSELQVRQDAVGVCATFLFSRNPNVARYHAGEGSSGSPRPCVQIWHTLTPVKGLGQMDYVSTERLCGDGTDCYEFKQSSKGWKVNWVRTFFSWRIGWVPPGPIGKEINSGKEMTNPQSMNHCKIWTEGQRSCRWTM